MQKREGVFIAGPVRTPIGSFGGSLKKLSAADLGTITTNETIKRSTINLDSIEEVIFGNARPAGGGPNVARQIAYRAGIPFTSTAYTVNKACGSGLKALILGYQEIALGNAHVILAGGTESMSRVPYLLEGARWGIRMGDQRLVDAMYQDGFLCPLSNKLMGETAETLAEIYKITREEQDVYALGSQQKAEAAIRSNQFREEIIGVPIANKENLLEEFRHDEHPRFGTTLESLRKLPPVFRENGTVTAGNSSGITDGAASMILLSETKVKALKVAPVARIVDYTTAGVDPHMMGIGPVPAIRKLFSRNKIDFSDIDLIELNEAFAAQVIACDRELHLPIEKLNVNGGAIALGHPIGCSGARIVVTLIHEMKRRRAKKGLATLCISGGMGIAFLLESA